MNKLGKLVILFTAVMLIPLLLAGCLNLKRTFSLKDYIEYEVEGVDGDGTITAKFNYKQFIEDAKIPEKYQSDIRDFKVRISQKDGLYNGDKVKLTVKYDRELEEKLNMELIDKSMTVTIDELMEKLDGDDEIKEDLPVETAEESSGESSVEEAESSKVEEKVEEQESSAEEVVEESSEQSVPEESAVEESAPEESVSEESSTEEAAIEESTEPEPQAEPEPGPMDGYVQTATQISQTALDAMKEDAEKRIREREAFDMDAGESLESVYYMESILMVSNDGTDDPKNAVYLIFRLNGKNPNGDFSWYDCFRYSDLTIDEAGNVSVDLSTASGLWERHIVEDNKRTYYYYYTGYATMEEIREFCETELGSDYSMR